MSTRETFRALHEHGTFLLPNAWDIGSARILASLGFRAVATTSSGHAASLGRLDQQITRDELVTHVRALAGATPIPISVDAERCFADDPDGIRETVDLLAAAGAAGISIEDYHGDAGRVEDLADAVERVAAAAQACARHRIVLTARAENYLYGRPDLDDTIARLRAYRQAGADVGYAPGLRALDDIARVVDAVPAPLNVLALADGPSVAELAAVGVRRVSTGGALARAAYGALRAAAIQLRDTGTSGYLARALTGDEAQAAFSPTPAGPTPAGPAE